MSLDTVFLVGAWVALAVLALGYAGLARAVNNLTAQLGHTALGGRIVGGFAWPIGGHQTFAEPTVVLFASHDCTACREIVPRLHGILDEIDPPVGGLVVYRQDNAGDGVERGTEYVVDSQAFDQYEVELVPTALFIDGTGRVGAMSPVGSLEQLEEFVRLVQARSRMEGAEL